MSSPTMLPPAPDLAPDAAILTPGDAPSHRGPAGRTAATPITIARGDGIGPEIMDATLRLLEAAGARLDIEEVEIGERVYRQGISSGVGAGTWSSLRRTGVFLKAPITTPQGGGFKSLNVTTRKTLGLYANVRPCASLHPFVPTKHPALDLVIIRENEEDTYAGIEHRQTREVVQCLKLHSRPGCERIARYAFEYARAHGRQKVSCFTKDNIMKLTDGLFHRVAAEVAAEYPDIGFEHQIVDIGAARLADTPERFDVILLPNLYGDILSDVAAQIAGSVGLAGSANIGEHCAMFEAIHGSAPDLAGQDLANPSGLMEAAFLMLVHLGQGDVATRARDAWLRTIEDGIHTADIHSAASRARVGTQAFADAVIDRLGEAPRTLRRTASLGGAASPASTNRGHPAPEVKALVGADLFLDWDEGDREPGLLAQQLARCAGPTLTLHMITNRGVMVWPEGQPETFRTDHWRCRFTVSDGSGPLARSELVELMRRVVSAGFDLVKMEGLFTFDGTPGYSRGQGE